MLTHDQIAEAIKSVQKSIDEQALINLGGHTTTATTDAKLNIEELHRTMAKLQRPTPPQLRRIVECRWMTKTESEPIPAPRWWQLRALWDYYIRKRRTRYFQVPEDYGYMDQDGNFICHPVVAAKLREEMREC